MWAARASPSRIPRNGPRLVGIFEVVPTEASTYVATTMSEPKMINPSSVRRLGLARRTRAPSVGARRLRTRGTGVSLLRGLHSAPASGPLRGGARQYPGSSMQASEPALGASAAAPPGLSAL